MNPRDQIVEEVILVGIGGWSRVCRLKRIDRRHRPSNRGRDVVRVYETECIEAVESAVVETGRRLPALHDFYRLHKFGMARRERRYFLRIGFMRVGIGL